MYAGGHSKTLQRKLQVYNTTMFLLIMFYGLLVFGRIVNTTAGSYYFSSGSEISHSRITFVYIAIMVLQ